MSVGSPMVARLGLANFLRQSRGGRTAAQAAAVAGFSKATLSRVERGETSISPGDTQRLLQYYGVPDEVAETFIELAYAAKKPGWWQRYKAAMPDWFNLFVGVETAAHRIRTYEADLIPGLLQIPEYTRAIAEQDIPAPATTGEIEEAVSLRQRRQEILTREDAPAQLSAVINEAALQRRVGGPDVLRAQLEHLLTALEQDNIDLRVLPFAVGAHPASYGSFVLLDYTVVDTDYALAYVEYCGGALYLEAEEEIALHSATFDGQQQRAASPEDTKELIKDALEQIG
ncbi:helix-turn-helix transcriptional regulator [Nocardiopsis sp. RSe5-2]|uniref:Helix-turn-helix transcriptional regulator n=1 Tax=Nocardiopsis endophytica TaxID=3018445 RepID=A0ABT4TZ23_9ACTN|nr:helix-turn-helix transcriptional regulator [Nocardiopsis endophytica]MDA2809940.1 helix-turn-helix transcriptional regulator [Nocardiopsis endophytica]